MSRFRFLPPLFLLAFLVVSAAFKTFAQQTATGKHQLANAWVICSSDSVSANGAAISSIGFNFTGWYPAEIPSTVLHALVQNGVYKNIFLNNNLEKISKAPFRAAWWYRTEFSGNFSQQTVLLRFEGINYKANIWLNGKKIADTTQIKNAFLQYQFNISHAIKNGKNVLAVEVFPKKAGDFSIGFVDWNPPSPDGNMGIFRPVFLETNNGVGVSNPFVVSELTKDFSQAELTASVEVINYQKINQSGEVILKFNGNELSKPVFLAPGERKKVIFTPKDFPQLKIGHPQLWWPYTLGTPYLYRAGFVFRHYKKIFDKKVVAFGIRTVSSYFTKEGFRGFKINGKKILIRGGGWTDRLLLDDNHESVENQLEYVRNIGLNTIRLEGFWGNSQTIYNLCDKMGIMIMVGWSAQWEWKDQLGKVCDKKYGGIISSSDIDMMSHAWQDQIVWLRNHPSIFTWLGGSDKIPKPALEKKYLNILSEFDSTRVYLASAREWTSLAGPTGVKMRGPYAYEPPVYWFSDTLYGGAFGFNTETGPGAQVPPLGSIKKMISKNHLWPIDSIWNYHCAHGIHAFRTLVRYTKALEARYGKATSAEAYAQKAQLLNYELMRPMFEAFSANRYKATGVIQWMLNSAWPNMYWQLYDYYLMPNGAYYGAKKASQPYHVIYDYARHSLFVVNDKLNDENNCTLKIRVYNDSSALKFEKEITVDLKANSSREVFILPKKNWGTTVYFLDLRLINENGKEIDNNFYWLSAKPDELDYKSKVPHWNFHTPASQYADFTALNHMPRVELGTAIKQEQNRKTTEFRVTLINNSRYIAFFVHPAIRDEKTGNIILPVLWSDNYVSLLPGETRVLTATIKNRYLENRKPQLIVSGYNLKKL